EVGAEPLAQREHRGRDVRPAPAQRRELGVERLPLLLERAQRHLLVHEPVLDLGLALLERFERMLGLAPILGQPGRLARLVQAALPRERGIGIGAPAPLGLPFLELRDLGLEALDAATAVVADRAANVVALRRERALLLLEAARARRA